MSIWSFHQYLLMNTNADFNIKIQYFSATASVQNMFHICDSKLFDN